jgi:hypothetical protein
LAAFLVSKNLKLSRSGTAVATPKEKNAKDSSRTEDTHTLRLVIELEPKLIILVGSDTLLVTDEGKAVGKASCFTN